MTRRRWIRVAAIGAATVLAVVAVVIAVRRDEVSPPASTSTGPATAPAPAPPPPPPPWGDFPGAPPDLAIPEDGSQRLGPPAADGSRELTIRRPDGSVLATAVIDPAGAPVEARYFDPDGSLTVVVGGARVAGGGVPGGGARVRCASSASSRAGFRWSAFPIRWRFGPRATRGLSRSRALRAVRQARGTWNANRSHCRRIPDRSRARFAFAGASSRPAGLDGVNVVHFGEVDRLGGVCVGTVACTITWVAAGRATETDTRIDRTPPGGYFTGARRPRRLDLQSVMVHESGHSLGFGHVSARSVVMFPSISRGTVAGRRLGRGDALANNRTY